MLITTIGRVVALFALLSFILINVTQTESQQGRQTSPKTLDRIIFTTTVIDKKGDLVTGLQQNNFQVSIDKKPAKIIDFREEDIPLSVGLIFDASASVGISIRGTGALINTSQLALSHFLEKSNQINEYFLLAFNNKPHLLLDWTSDSKTIVKTLGVLQPKGNTAFYDACYLAINKIRHGRYSKRVLILITDGKDNVSKYSLAQVRDELRASDVLVYSVNFSGRPIAGTSFDMEGQDILDELSLLSGGRSFYKRFLKAAEAVSVFEMIANELRRQYTIAVIPDLPSGNSKWHKIRIKVGAAANAPGEMKHLSARTREGFHLSHR